MAVHWDGRHRATRCSNLEVLYYDVGASQRYLSQPLLRLFQEASDCRLGRAPDFGDLLHGRIFMQHLPQDLRGFTLPLIETGFQMTQQLVTEQLLAARYRKPAETSVPGCRLSISFLIQKANHHRFVPPFRYLPTAQDVPLPGELASDTPQRPHCTPPCRAM